MLSSSESFGKITINTVIVRRSSYPLQMRNGWTLRVDICKRSLVPYPDKNRPKCSKGQIQVDHPDKNIKKTWWGRTLWRVVTKLLGDLQAIFCALASGIGEFGQIRGKSLPCSVHPDKIVKILGRPSNYLNKFDQIRSGQNAVVANIKSCDGWDGKLETQYNSALTTTLWNFQRSCRL